MFKSRKFYQTMLLPSIKVRADGLRAEFESPLSQLLAGEEGAPLSIRVLLLKHGREDGTCPRGTARPTGHHVAQVPGLAHSVHSCL